MKSYTFEFGAVYELYFQPYDSVKIVRTDYDLYFGESTYDCFFFVEKGKLVLPEKEDSWFVLPEEVKQWAEKLIKLKAFA